MKERNRLCFYLLCISFICLVPGCRIRMTAEERLGINSQPSVAGPAEENRDGFEMIGQSAPETNTIESESGETQIFLPEEHDSAAETVPDYGAGTIADPAVTEEARYTDETVYNAGNRQIGRYLAGYVPFDPVKIRQSLLHIAGENTDELTPHSVDGGTALNLAGAAYEGTDYAELMNLKGMSELDNPLFQYNRGEGARLRKPLLEYFCEQSNAIPGEEAAEEAILSFLEEVGYDVAYIEWCYLSPDVLQELRRIRNSYYQNTGFGMIEEGIREWEQEGILYYVIRQKVDGILIESFTGESLIEAAYSPGLSSIIYLRTSMPVYKTHETADTEVEMISRNDAELSAQEILKKKPLGNWEITSAELVYAHNIIGSYDYENRTGTLWPAWKVGFRFEAEGREWTDYIMLNAETGEQLTNATPLY